MIRHLPKTTGKLSDLRLKRIELLPHIPSSAVKLGNNLTDSRETGRRVVEF